VVAEVYEDVARRRAAGEIPPDLEADLDAAFARLAPPGAVGGDLGLVLARAERASFIDVDVPVESALPGASLAKKAIRKVVRWYLRYLAEQVSALGGSVVRALQAIDARLGAVEQGRAPVPARVAAELALVAERDVAAPVAGMVVALCNDLPGPVLVAESGRGGLLGALAGAGVAARGVEPRRPLVGDALRAGLAVVVAPVGQHLAGSARRSLGGVVLTGIVDREPVASQLALLDAAVTAVAPGGVVCVVGTDPAAWGAGRTEVEADLAPGRPLRAATWVALLAHAGLRDASARSFDGSYVVHARMPVEGGA
jgi:hypothetical protein